VSVGPVLTHHSRRPHSFSSVPTVGAPHRCSDFISNSGVLVQASVGLGFRVKILACDFRALIFVAGACTGCVIEMSNQRIEFF
jgi:hypothetical protein